jgi:hypothetical protein
MVETLVLHIGVHKTGTTAIQASLAHLYDELLEQGILYPRSGRGAFPGHPNLAWEVIGYPRYDAGIGGGEQLVQEVRDTDPRAVVISSEEFLRNTSALPEWCRWLAKALGVSDVQVIGYVRPQWEYIESSYAQQVKGGFHYMMFDDYVEREITNTRFDYYQMFDYWRQVFGDRLTIRPFAKSAFIGQDVIDDFWNTVECLPEPPELRARLRNPRAGQRTTEMLRVLRQLLAETGLDEIGAVRPIFEQANRALAERLPSDTPFHRLTQEMVDRIADHFAQHNKDFVRDFMNGDDGGLFTPPAAIAPPRIWTLAEATDDERRLFATLLRDAVDALLDATR